MDREEAVELEQHQDIFERHDPLTELVRSWGWIDSSPPTFPAWACLVQNVGSDEWKIEWEGAITSEWGLPLLFRDEAGALRACLYFYYLYASQNNVPTKKWKAMLLVDEAEFEALRNKSQ